MAPSPEFCDNCERTTLVVEEAHYSGRVPGAGNCIACGWVRTDDEADHDYLQWIATQQEALFVERS